jgi:preprotein translocase subunit SecG
MKRFTLIMMSLFLLTVLIILLVPKTYGNSIEDITDSPHVIVNQIRLFKLPLSLKLSLKKA